MSSAIETTNNSAEVVVASLKTSARDKSSSLMFALIVFFGTGVVMLGALFIMKMPRGAPIEEIIIEPTPAGNYESTWART